MYITRQKLTEIRTAAGLTPGDDALARYLDDLMGALNGPPFDGRFNEGSAGQTNTLAATVGVSASDLAKVLALATAAGLVVKIS